MSLATILSNIFHTHGQNKIDLSNPSIKQAYEEGLENQDGLLPNPYHEGTKQYIAWALGSEKRVRQDMTIW